MYIYTYIYTYIYIDIHIYIYTYICLGRTLLLRSECVGQATTVASCPGRAEPSSAPCKPGCMACTHRRNTRRKNPMATSRDFSESGSHPAQQKAEKNRGGGGPEKQLRMQSGYSNHILIHSTQQWAKRIMCKHRPPPPSQDLLHLTRSVEYFAPIYVDDSDLRTGPSKYASHT